MYKLSVRSILAVIMLILFSKVSSSQQLKDSECEDSYWPDGGRAAVCLTYDDGSDCHLDLVAPTLEKHGLKGTFFVPATQSLKKRLEEWRMLFKRGGHELGNHTLWHPCSGSRFSFVTEYDLEKYSMVRISDELVVATLLLRTLDGKKERTFAYTCGEYKAGRISFLDTIHTMFDAARAAGGGIPESMEGYDIYWAPSVSSGSETTGEQLIKFAKEALAKGTIVIFLFHHVGACREYASSAEAHQQLIDYLAENKDLYWIDTFTKVMKYIRSKQQMIEKTSK